MQRGNFFGPAFIQLKFTMAKDRNLLTAKDYAQMGKRDGQKLAKMMKLLQVSCPDGVGKTAPACTLREPPTKAGWNTSTPLSQKLSRQPRLSPNPKSDQQKSKPHKPDPLPRATFFNPKYKRFIGIDGGASTGYAVWDRPSKTLMTVKTLDFWSTIEQLGKDFVEGETCIVIENPSAIKGLYHRMREANPNIMANKGQKVGRVKRESELMMMYFEKSNWDYIPVAPTRSKVSADYFKTLTGWQKTCSQHGRDAAMLVFGK